MHNTFYDITRATLWAEKPLDGQEMSPRLVLTFTDGKPRFTVYSGIKGTVINFSSDVVTMLTILEMTEKVAKSYPKGTHFTVNSKSQWKNGKRTNELHLSSTLRIGKTAKGICYIMIEEEGKPKIPFALYKTRLIDFNDDAQNELPEEEVSKEFTLAFCLLMKNAIINGVSQHARDAYEHGEYKPGVIGDFGNNNNNNWKKKGTSMAGSSGVPEPSSKTVDVDTFSDDIPF